LLGEKEEGYAWLVKAFEERDPPFCTLTATLGRRKYGLTPVEGDRSEVPV